MVDKNQIKGVLDRLAAVEAAMGDPAVMADAKRYRETVREHTALRKLEAAAKRYFKILDDIEGNASLLEDPDFAEEAKAEIERLKVKVVRVPAVAVGADRGSRRRSMRTGERMPTSPSWLPGV